MMSSIIDVLPPNIVKVTFIHCTAGLNSITSHTFVLPLLLSLFLIHSPSFKNTHLKGQKNNLSPFDLLCKSHQNKIKLSLCGYMFHTQIPNHTVLGFEYTRHTFFFPYFFPFYSSFSSPFLGLLYPPLLSNPFSLPPPDKVMTGPHGQGVYRPRWDWIIYDTWQKAHTLQLKLKTFYIQAQAET